MQQKSCFYLLSYIMSDAQYNTINEPLVYASDTSNGFLSFAFDDTAENVWIAAMDIPSTDLEYIVNTAKTVIHETLDIPVHINAILINPSDKPTQVKHISYAQSQKNIQATISDSYILIFKSIQDAQEYLYANPNQIQSDTPHLPEATSYYDTVIKYLNQELMYIPTKNCKQPKTTKRKRK